jgi:hypothetical protein
MKPLHALLRLVLFACCLAALQIVIQACGSSSAYTRVATVADKLTPALGALLQAADKVHPLPGGQQALEATERLLDAWAAQDANGFNAAAPCAREALRAASVAASMAGEEALSMRLEHASQLLGAISADLVCPPRPPAPAADEHDAGASLRGYRSRAQGELDRAAAAGHPARAAAAPSFPLASHGALVWS